MANSPAHLAVELKHKAKHAVRGWVLRAKVDGQIRHLLLRHIVCAAKLKIEAIKARDQLTLHVFGAQVLVQHRPLRLEHARQIRRHLLAVVVDLHAHELQSIQCRGLRASILYWRSAARFSARVAASGPGRRARVATAAREPARSLHRK